ncbi:hypothetical protein TARUN_2130 [Trichoderma arundinaceum]|uniref:Uncharacterized protein n=1 Tax=Trichoderma arundinaceum TaxID=490622 RepID=A0A395NVB6_TRIAR|nr:hypothetical protein TARUN_2130 [Trichoderma arundinaceum]
MFKFLSKLSPRAIGENLDRRFRIRDGLNKITKIAKETRLTKRKLAKFAVMAFLIVSQGSQNLLHHAVDQLIIPASLRGIGMQRIIPEVPWAETQEQVQAWKRAHTRGLQKQGFPKIILTSPNGLVTHLEEFPRWNKLRRSDDLARIHRQWEWHDRLSPIWMPRAGNLQPMRLMLRRTPSTTRGQRRNQIRVFFREQNQTQLVIPDADSVLTPSHREASTTLDSERQRSL